MRVYRITGNSVFVGGDGGDDGGGGDVVLVVAW